MSAPALHPDELTDPEVHATGAVHDLWRWLRLNAPVYRHDTGPLPAFWSLSRYDDVRMVYRHPEVFSSAKGVLLRARGLGEDPGGGLTLALTDPPRHMRLHGLIADRFNERCARGMEETMRATVRSVIADAIDRGECDFAHDVGTRLSIYLICQLLGVPERDYEMLLDWTVAAFTAGTSLVVHPQIMRYFVELMVARMADPTDDVVSMLVTGRVGDQPLTESEILLNCENLIGATENAGLSMSAGVQAFLEHPRQWQRLQHEPALLPSAVEEVLRWTSSATHSMRTATRPVELHDHRIAAGDKVVLWIPSANRDESVFADPYRFDITRRPNRHLALGSGEHTCIGGTMARHQMRLLYAELMAMSKHIEQTGPAVPVRSVAVSGPARLPLRIIPR